MTKNKKIAVSMLVFSVILGGTVYGVNQTSAQENGMHDSLIEKLVAKFNLNKDEVTQVFTEERGARRAANDVERQKRLEEKLTLAVTSGEITNEQKQLILNKMAELQKERTANREAHANLSAEERKTEMDEHKAELEKWASDNGIDLKYLMAGLGRGMGGERMGQGKGMGNGQGMGLNK